MARPVCPWPPRGTPGTPSASPPAGHARSALPFVSRPVASTALCSTRGWTSPQWGTGLRRPPLCGGPDQTQRCAWMQGTLVFLGSADHLRGAMFHRLSALLSFSSWGTETRARCPPVWELELKGASDQGALPIGGCGDTPFLTQRPHNKEVLQKPWTRGGGQAVSTPRARPRSDAAVRSHGAAAARMPPALACGHCELNLSRCARSICGHHHHPSCPGLSVCCRAHPSPGGP